MGERPQLRTMTVHDATRDPPGAPLPGIVYGTAWKKDATADCVERALRAGFRGIDTACQPKHYHEPGVGQGVAAFLGSPAGRGVTRAALYLQTKFTPLSGQDPERVPYDPSAPPRAQVEASIAASLEHLRTHYLDCLVLHSPIADAQAMADVWRTMEDAVLSGTVRRLGISNCYDLESLRALHARSRVKPVVLQNRFYADTGYDRALRAFCAGHAITYQSFWTLSANAPVLGSRVVMALAARHSRSAAQVLFRYLSQEGVVPLTGTKSDTHMRDGLAIFAFALTDAERAAITALLAEQPPGKRS